MAVVRNIPVFVVWFLVCGNDASPPPLAIAPAVPYHPVKYTTAIVFHCYKLIAWSVFHIFRDVDAIDSEAPCSSSCTKHFFYAASWSHRTCQGAESEHCSTGKKFGRNSIAIGQCLNSKGFDIIPLRWEWRWGYPVVFQIWCSPNQLPRSSLCPGVVSLTLPYFHYWYHPPSLDPSIHVIAKNDFLILRSTGNDFTECQTC